MFTIFRATKKSEDNESADSYDDLSDSEDDDESNVGLANRIPASHEVQMAHGPRSILALASDPSGARLASGSIDSRFVSIFFLPASSFLCYHFLTCVSVTVWITMNCLNFAAFAFGISLAWIHQCEAFEH